MTDLRIFGAGLAGLITAHVLRSHAPRIVERQPNLPNNHAALLRFRSETVSGATGIDFTRVKVYKAIKHGHRLHTEASIAMANSYSRKVIGWAHPRSIMDLRPVDRWIAPPNFVQLLADGLPQSISYGSTGLNRSVLLDRTRTTPIISTIPMPKLMTMANWSDPPAFQSRPVTTIICQLHGVVDLHQTIYYPNPSELPYRASITDSRLIIELITVDVTSVRDTIHSLAETVIKSVLEDFGLTGISHTHTIKHMEFGKLMPFFAPGMDKNRRDFIMAMTDIHRCYSIGRFATWRQILLDDIVVDAKRIKSMIEGRDAYRNRLEEGRIS